MSLKRIIADSFPFIGKYKRYCVALIDSISAIRKTYSQHGEDIVILELLQEYDLTDSIYLDIGANHPTDISNTFLLYKNGLQGIIVEPNEELIGLFKKFRKRDITISIGCGNKNSILKFNISKTPVISSFVRNDSDQINVYKTVYVPMMKIDDVVSDFNYSFINFLSIDVEGLNYEVLEGGKQTIERTLFVCLEFDAEMEIDKYHLLLGNTFEKIRVIGCNVLFKNKSLAGYYRHKQ